MQKTQGISTTIGILIVAAAIVVVGVAIYFVYINTEKAQPFEIVMDDRLVVEVGSEAVLTGVVTSEQVADSILLGLERPDMISATLDETTVQAGDTITLRVQGNTPAQGTITLSANQGTDRVEHTISVRIFSAEGNTNTSVNQNTNSGQINTNTGTNTNSLSPTEGRFISSELNIAMNYPDTWGQGLTAELNRLKPAAGDFIYQYFENLDNYDIPGHVAVTGATANYQPTQWAGTPFWFASTIDPSASVDEIEAQIADAGFVSLSVSVETLDGRKAVKMFNYRGFYNQYLDVSYIIPSGRATSYDTVFISRSLEIVADNDTPESDAQAAARVRMNSILDGSAPEPVMKRYTEFENAIDSLTFLQ